MKNLKISLLTLLLLFVYVSVQSQNADEIIARNIEAMGGKDKINSISSIHIENTFTANGNETTSTTVILNGKGMKNKNEVMGQTMIQCFTDKSGWMINPMYGSTTPTEMTIEEYNSGNSQLNIGDNFIDYSKKGNKVELLGKERVQDIDAFKLKVTTSDSISTFYYLDPSTFYVLQSSMDATMLGQPMTIITTYRDYKKTDYGFVMPHTYDVNYGYQFSLNVNLKKVEFNKPVDPVIFELGNMD